MLRNFLFPRNMSLKSPPLIIHILLHPTLTLFLSSSLVSYLLVSFFPPLLSIIHCFSLSFSLPPSLSRSVFTFCFLFPFYYPLYFYSFSLFISLFYCFPCFSILLFISFLSSSLFLPLIFPLLA